MHVALPGMTTVLWAAAVRQAPTWLMTSTTKPLPAHSATSGADARMVACCCTLSASTADSSGSRAVAAAALRRCGAGTAGTPARASAARAPGAGAAGAAWPAGASAADGAGAGALCGAAPPCRRN